jgi:hypothetical protein
MRSDAEREGPSAICVLRAVERLTPMAQLFTQPAALR